MKKTIKKALALLLTAVTVFVASSISGIELFTQANAAGTDFLTFELINNNTEYEISDCDTAAIGELIIPETYEGKPVTQISDHAFENCTSLRSITIPESITIIGVKAFEYCYALESINIPAGVTSISESTFSDCAHLESVSFTEGSKLTSIGDNAFIYCVGLSSITIPESVTIIGVKAFECCYALESINIPAGVTSISESTFSNCNHLESVSFTEGSKLTSIGDNAFIYCVGLSRIAIPKGVTSIGYAAFDVCDHLFTVYYGSDESDREKIEIGSKNSKLLTADWDYTARATGVTVSPTGKALAIGATQQLTATVVPEDAVNKNVTWESSDTAIATVDENGLVTAKAVGTATITVKTEDRNKTASCTIRVIKALEKITVSRKPNKVNYFVGDTLNTRDLLLTASFSGGDTMFVSSGFTCTPTVLNTADKQTITVNYKGKTCTFSVNVAELTVEGLSVNTSPAKVSYVVGDTLDTTGLTLTATYSNGTTKTIAAADVSCTPTALLTAGTQTITASYGGESCTFTVDVFAEAPDSLTIKEPSSTTVNYGVTLKLKATIDYIPEGCKLVWSADNDCLTIKPSANGKTCSVTSNANGVATVTVKLVDENGDTVLTASQQLTATVRRTPVTRGK